MLHQAHIDLKGGRTKPLARQRRLRLAQSTDLNAVHL
jgi:hypothetical protein